MNMWLGKATSVWMEGRNEGKQGPSMELGMIQAAKIRYVHFPDNMQVEKQVKTMIHRGKQGQYKGQKFTR